MNRATYTLPLTGKEVEKKLALLDGDNAQVTIKANKVSALSATTSSDDDLTLATKSYVDSHVSPATGSENVQGDWNQTDENAPVYPLDEKYIPDTIARAKHNHEFKDIVDSAYDDSSKWKEITDLLNQHAYGDLVVVTPANGCPGYGGTAGTGYRVCDCCGHKKIEQLKPDHQWNVNEADLTTHTLQCWVCGTTKTEPHDDTGFTYASSSNGVSTVWSFCNICACDIDSHTHFACGDVGCNKCDLIIPNPDPNGCTHKWEQIGLGGSDGSWTDFYECSKCGEYTEVAVE